MSDLRPSISRSVGRQSRATAAPQQGFTIVELLIATLVFTMVLILLTTGVLQFTRQYYKGVISSQTQSAARALIDDASRAIQFNSGDVAKLTTTSTGTPANAANPAVGYCIGESKRYSFKTNVQVTDGPPYGANQAAHGLVSDTVTGCNTNTPALPVASLSNLSTPNARELLGEHMRLAKFEITPGGSDLYLLTVRVIYGDNDLLTDTTPNATCKPQTGSQFCAVSELSTTVQKRVN